MEEQAQIGYAAPMTQPTPPRPRKEPKRIEQLGRVRIDDYAWMKDDNWQAVLRDPVGGQGRRARAPGGRERLRRTRCWPATEALQARLFEEMKGRIKEDDASRPHARRRRSSTSAATRSAPSIRAIVRRPRGGGDGESGAAGRGGRRPRATPTIAVGAAGHSPDHALYAWAEDEQGSEYLPHPGPDLATGEVLPGAIESAYRRLRLLAGLARGCSGSGATRTPGPPRSSAGRRAAATTCWSTRSRTRACSSASASPPTDSHILIGAGNQETSEVLADPGRRSHRRAGAWPSRAASGVRYEPRPLGRPLGDPHQRRRRGRLQADGLATPPSRRARPGATGSPTSPAG